MHLFIQLLVPAHPTAVQERVQRLLLAVLGQAAEPARARPGVHAAWLALFERARQAAAAAGLLHQLTAHRHRRTHGQGLLIARLARHVRRAAADYAQQGNHQEGNTQLHVASLSSLCCVFERNRNDYQLNLVVNPFFAEGLSPNIRGVSVASTGALRAKVHSITGSNARNPLSAILLPHRVTNKVKKK